MKYDQRDGAQQREQPGEGLVERLRGEVDCRAYVRVLSHAFNGAGADERTQNGEHDRTAKDLFRSKRPMFCTEDRIHREQ